MKEPLLHHVESRVSSDELSELEGSLLDDSWSHSTFDGVSMDVIHGVEVVARVRPHVFTENEILGAWSAFPSNERSVAGLSFLQAADHLFSVHALFWYAKQSRLFQENGGQRVNGTCFTSFGAYRGTRGELRKCPGYLLVTILTKGTCSGGAILLPEYGCSFKLNNGDLLILNNDVWRADLEATNCTDDYARIVIEMDSFVIKENSLRL